MSCLWLTGTHTEKCQNSEYCDWSVSIKGSNNYSPLNRSHNPFFLTPNNPSVFAYSTAAFSICHLFRLLGDTFVLWHQCKTRHPFCLSKSDDGYHIMESVFPTSIYFGTCDRVLLIRLRLWKGLFWSVGDRCFLVYQFIIITTITNCKLSGFINLYVALKTALSLWLISIYSTNI